MTKNDHMTAFQRALLDSVLNEYAGVPHEDELPDVFSDAFKTWAAKFVSKNRPGRIRARTVLKRVLIAAIIMLLLAGAAMAIPAVREAFVDYYFYGNDVVIKIAFDPDEAATAPKEIVEPYTIAYVPEGYELAIDEVSFAGVIQWWRNEDDQWIRFTQRTVPHENGDHWMAISAENTSRRRVLMGGYSVEIIESPEISMLIWTNDAYLFMLDLPHSITEEEMNAIFASWGPIE